MARPQKTATIKKRPNGDGSIYPYKGKWRVSVSLGKIGGVRRRKVITRDTREEAQDARRQLLVDSGLHQEPNEKITTGDYLDRWLENNVKPNLSTATWALRDVCIRKHITPAIGHIPLASLTAAHIRECLAKIKGTGIRLDSLSCLKCAINDAVRDGIVTSNPAKPIRGGGYKRKDIDPFTDEECRRILDAAEGHRVEGMFRIALSFGLRIAEICGLRWCDVDFIENEINIVQQATTVRGHVHIRPPKSKAGRRTIKLTRATTLSLRIAKARNDSISSVYVFPAKSGGPMCYPAARYAWKQVLDKAGVRFRAPHHARHTAATRLVADGVPIPVVAAILGHARASITLDVYAKYLPSQQQAATDSITSGLG